MDCVSHDFFMGMVNQGLSDKQISEHLKSCYPELKGLSERSVRRHRDRYSLARLEPIPKAEVDRQVIQAVAEVGESSGYRFVKGYLESKPDAKPISEKRIAKSLKENFPASHQRRYYGIQDSINPVPYRAEYFGHRLHLDQNEKLAMFGVTHVAAIDGYSGLIVAHSTMPVKNNVTIYDDVFRKSVLDYGVWDQLVVDCGKEFNLSLSGQNNISNFRTNRNRATYIQIPSTKNNRIERVWVEVNSRVTFPVKEVYEWMVETGQVHPANPHHLFATSFAGCQVTSVGLVRLFDARNNRYCRRRGKPVDLMESSFNVGAVDPASLPTGFMAAQTYRENGGFITDPAPFGIDPLENSQNLQAQRDQLLANYRFSPSEIFNLTVNRNASALCGYVSFIIDINSQLSGNGH